MPGTLSPSSSFLVLLLHARDALQVLDERRVLADLFGLVVALVPDGRERRGGARVRIGMPGSGGCPDRGGVWV